MKKPSITRRNFMKFGAGAVALTSALDNTTVYPISPRKPPSALDPSSTAGTDREMAIAADWAQSFGAIPDGRMRQAKTKLLPELLKPPFSFVYGSEQSSDLLVRWKSEVGLSESDERGNRHQVRFTDPQTGLAVLIEVMQFSAFPAVEWVLRFKNTSTSDTPILEDVQALDGHLQCEQGDPDIHYAKGATCSPDDFMPLRRVLNKSGEHHLEPGGGRSSSDFLPFFNLETKGEGVIIAIGWTGQWAISFRRPDGPNVHVRCGMAATHLKLRPGEEIRSPRILVLFWQGKRLRGHNVLRQFLLSYHRPSAGGKLMKMPMCNNNWGGTPIARHLENIRQIVAHGLPMDYYWIDAEWFGKGPWWSATGDWRVNRDLYPHGMKPISDLLHASGRKFLVWFEPERVCEGTPWYEEHADWLLEVPKPNRIYNFGTSQADPMWVRNESLRNQLRENDRLFNLGIPQAREFLADFMSARIDEFGIDCYRHDANIAPVEFWRAADGPDRIGITEIRWVEGLYAFWDELRARHPSLMIDVCASGGRRIDLETLSRCLPLWRSDYYATDVSQQCQTHGLLYWVPVSSTYTGDLSNHSIFDVRSSLGAGLVFGLFGVDDATRDVTNYNFRNFPFRTAKAELETYREIQKYFYGDYYPLTEYSQANDAWMAYQLHLPTEDEGLVVVLKRAQSNFVSALFQLKALEPNASYQLTSLDNRESSNWLGSHLLNQGLDLQLPRKPDSALLRYRRKTNP